MIHNAQFRGFGWEARRDEPGRQGTLQHGEPNTFGQPQLQLLPAQSPRFATLDSGHDALRLRRGKPRPAGKNKPSAGRGAYAIRAGLDRRPLFCGAPSGS
jgi:hypothetical protein